MACSECSGYGTIYPCPICSDETYDDDEEGYYDEEFEYDY